MYPSSRTVCCVVWMGCKDGAAGCQLHAPVVLKAQQEPHIAWFLTSVTASWSRQSTWSGVWVMLPWLNGVPARAVSPCTPLPTDVYHVCNEGDSQHVDKHVDSWAKRTSKIACEHS
jgi:hypothetical protein